MKELLTTLTEREKKLIYILVLFLLVIGGWFLVIKPSLKNYNQAKLNKANRAAELTKLKDELKDYQQADGQLAILDQNYQVIIDKYNGVYTNDEIDDLITKQIMASGLTPASLNISEGNTVEQNSSNSTTNKQKEVSTKTTSSNIITKTVTTTVQGNLNGVGNLLDKVKTMKGVSVSSMNYSDKQDSSSQSTNINSYDITFLVYMIDK